MMSCELSHVTLHVGLEHADDVIMMKHHSSTVPSKVF